MPRDTDGLVVTLGANFKTLERDMKQAGLVAQKGVDEIESKFERMNPKLGSGFTALRAGLAGLATGLAAGLIASLAEANRALVEMDKTARLANVSLRELQQIQFAGAKVGIASGDVNAGVSSLAKTLNDARREENELTKLLDANNIKWKDREGTVISVNRALEIAADLMQRAGTEADKLDIAKKMSIPENLIPMLERGVGQLTIWRNEAEKSGSVIDEQIVAKAREFDSAWNNAMANFAAYFKAGLVNTASDLATWARDAIAKAREVAQAVRDSSSPAAAAGRRVGNALGTAANPYGSLPAQFTTPGQERLRAQLNAYLKRDTNIPGKSEKGAGGGGGLTEEEDRYNQVVRYIEALERTGRILEAEVSTIGLSNAERAKAIELARIGNVTDAEQLKLIEQQVAKNEQLRQTRESLNRARQGVFDAANFAGNQVLDVFDAMIDKSKSLQESLADVTKALMKAALQAAILGQGPLAGLLGASGVGGAPGGLIGGLLNFGGFRAAGGAVSGRKAYIVGENGPELFAPGQNGQIIPNSALASSGGGGAPPVVNVYAPPGSSVETRQSTMDGRQIVDVMIGAAVKDIASNGPLAKALQGRYGMNRARGR